MTTLFEQLRQFLTGTIKYDSEDQRIYCVDIEGGMQLIAEIRGYGAIQNFTKKDGQYDLQAANWLQDYMGYFISAAIAEKLEPIWHSTEIRKPHHDTLCAWRIKAGKDVYIKLGKYIDLQENIGYGVSAGHVEGADVYVITDDEQKTLDLDQYTNEYYELPK